MSEITSDTDPAGTPLRGWPLALALLGVSFVLVLVLYNESVRSAVDLWWNRSAYNHGFVIIPISLYLIWDRRAALAAMAPKPFWPGLIVVGGCSLVWVLARSAGINEAEHFAVVGVIQGIVLAVLGLRLFWAMMLPMMYLWLMVPTGTVLYPFLQDIAHWLSVGMLQLSGIPVYAEGIFIEVPMGRYEVAPGCAGLNFILAGLALAPLYGYMMYDTMRKRIITVAIMMGVAVLANGVRIYGIIALAEFTDKRIDIIDDHLLYGWGFFAVILLVLGYVGTLFADPEPAVSTNAGAAVSHGPRCGLIVGGVLVMAVLTVFPAWRLLSLSTGVSSAPPLIDAMSLDLDKRGAPGGTWLPVYPYASQTLSLTAVRRGVNADVFLAGYFTPRAASEMITSGNDPIGSERYNKIGGFSRTIKSAQGDIGWRFMLYRSGRDVRLVARARWVDGAFVASSTRAKVMQARATLFWSKKQSGVILVSVPVTGDVEMAADDLTTFLEGARLDGLFSVADPQLQ